MIQATDDLESQIYYHGLITRQAAESLLKSEGDFLARATEAPGNKYDIVLSIRRHKEIKHLILIHIDGHWQLPISLNDTVVKKFATIPALVDYYMKNKIRSTMILKSPIHRQRWLIKHEMVHFDMKKDHLGTGNFCDVHKDRFDRGNEIVDVAIKICHNSGSSSSSRLEGEAKAARIMMIAEAKIMSLFNHRNVLMLYGVACDHPPVLIVLEFCPGGALDKHLQNKKDEIENGERMIYVMEAAREMRYLHQRNCVHRDLAARNCLISAQGHIKIADFGLSKLMENEKPLEPMHDESPQIPLRWMAPESLQRLQKFSLASDVWSFGVLVYEIFNNGEKPWPDLPNKKIATLIRKAQMPTLPPKTPSELGNIVGAMWVLALNERITFRDICLKVWKILKKCPPLLPSKYTVNKLPGVERLVSIKEAECEDEDVE